MDEEDFQKMIDRYCLSGKLWSAMRYGEERRLFWEGEIRREKERQKRERERKLKEMKKLMWERQRESKW